MQQEKRMHISEEEEREESFFRLLIQRFLMNSIATNKQSEMHQNSIFLKMTLGLFQLKLESFLRVEFSFKNFSAAMAT